jgi:ABC-type molybdate transport system substrate-binding protein
LYNEYKTQFTKETGDTQFVSSNSSATLVRKIYAAAELEYFVTSYASTVIKINSISAAGVMNYDVLSVNIPEGSFINVIFVVK